MDKFIIGNNEMGPDKEIWYITHLLNPVAIIAILPGFVNFEAGNYYQHFDFNGEKYTLKIHFMFTTEFDADQHGLQAAKMVERAWRWYRAYMQWEDEQFNLLDE